MAVFGLEAEVPGGFVGWAEHDGAQAFAVFPHHDHPAWYDGIVEEQVRTRSELLNPFKFFGRPHRVIQNMLAVYLDTKSFLDYKKIETYLAVEYFVIYRSPKLNDAPR